MLKVDYSYRALCLYTSSQLSVIIMIIILIIMIMIMIIIIIIIIIIPREAPSEVSL